MPDAPRRIEAITFDFWNTLVVDSTTNGRDRRLDKWMGVLEDAGFATERAAIDAAMAVTWDRFQAKWQQNEQYTHVEAAIEIVEDLGYDLPPDVHDRLLATFVYAEGTHPSLTEGIAECLRTLRSAGLRIGIVCDVGMTPSSGLRDILEQAEVLGLFDHWSFSDEVGHYKPSPVIFEHALAGLGVAAEHTAHVGDLRRTDIAGARDLGILAIRYTGAFDDAEFDGPEGDHVIGDHADLPAVLGLI